jgi:hypothetical protein
MALNFLGFSLAVLTATTLLAQNPTLQLKNLIRLGSSNFQIGDQFKISVAAAPNQPISVRTTFHGHGD